MESGHRKPQHRADGSSETIRIEHEPGRQKLEQLGVDEWPIWTCDPSEFPWEYETTETCLILEGRVDVVPLGSTEPVPIGPGDLVSFPAGLRCVWKVHEAVRKRYRTG